MTRIGGTRWPAVAGSFYPDDAADLSELVDGLFRAASALPEAEGQGHAVRGTPVGILVPHAGLVYSGVVAAAGWATIAGERAGHGRPPASVVILGTNHVAPSLRGVAVWPSGTWDSPTAVVDIDEGLAADIIGLGGPFTADPEPHHGEHSIEVQLPVLVRAAPDAQIVALAVGTGTGAEAIDAGRRLGQLLATRRADGAHLVLAISTDMAHYPTAEVCERVTRDLVPSILAVDAPGLAAREEALRAEGQPGLACGMCGIEPAVVGLAALREMGASSGTMLAAATSADAGGPRHRTVGYLAVRFDA